MRKIFIPGRLEFIGKHTDYCGGRSIVCAIDRGFHVEFEPSGSPHVAVSDADTGEKIQFPFEREVVFPAGHWMKYPAAVAMRLANNFGPAQLRGANISFRSDLPKAAGLSSSSAFMIAIYFALAEVNGLSNTELYRENITCETDLADYLACIENGASYKRLAGNSGVGTQGGSQDHAAILLCKKDKFTEFSYRPLKKEQEFHWPDELSIIIASSGLAAEKTGGAKEKYNRCSKMVAEMVEKWPGNEISLASMIENSGILGSIKVSEFIKFNRFSYSQREMVERLYHFETENCHLLPMASSSLKKGEVKSAAEILNISHHFADKWLKNQTAETNFLQKCAIARDALGASAFGAGFGGSVFAIVKKHDAEDFMRDWEWLYKTEFPELKPEFFEARPLEKKIS